MVAHVCPGKKSHLMVGVSSEPLAQMAKAGHGHTAPIHLQKGPAATEHRAWNKERAEVLWGHCRRHMLCACQPPTSTREPSALPL